MPLTRIKALGAIKPKNQYELKFVDAFNSDIVALNNEIDCYNNSTDEAQQLTLLKEIDQSRNTLNNRYYLDDIARSPSYQAQMHDQLDREIREAFDKLKPPKEEDLASLHEIIRQMPHAKLTQLMAILWENTDLNNKLNNLYKPDELPGYTHFQQFLNTHTIQSLSAGMAGNSRNIKICKTGPGNTPLVLKVDRRFDQPKSTEDYLRKVGVRALATTYGERQGTFIAYDARTGRNINVTATLVITEYCPGGDLNACTRKSKADRNWLTSVLDYYSQMADILHELQLHEVAFTDAKNENWLIGQDNKLRISDTKSFRRTRKGQVAATYRDDDPRSSIILTQSHLPEEFSLRLAGKEITLQFSAEAMHAYMLGKNLYQSLTGYHSMVLTKIKSFKGSGYFDAPIFQKVPIGEKLKRMLQAMVLDNLSVRSYSLVAFKKALHDYSNAEPVAAEINELLEKIKSTSVSSVDSKMEEFIDEKTKYFINIYPRGDNLLAFRDELKSLYDKLNFVKEKIDKADPTHFTSISYKKIISKIRAEIAVRYDNMDVIERATAVKIEKEVETIFEQDSLIFKIETLLSDIKSTSYLQKSDVIMIDFINENTNGLTGKTSEELATLEQDLNALYKKLKPIATEVNMIVQGFRSALFNKDSKSEKATKIENAFKNIPVTERVNVLTNRNNEAIRDFQDALAFHRTTRNKNKLIEGNKTEIDLTDKTTAKTFKKFKEKFGGVGSSNDDRSLSTDVNPRQLGKN